jgi:hypothetical protein
LSLSLIFSIIELSSIKKQILEAILNFLFHKKQLKNETQNSLCHAYHFGSQFLSAVAAA